MRFVGGNPRWLPSSAAAELTLAREMLGLDNIGFDNMAIGKFAINNIGLHIVANGNIGIGRQSFS